MARWRAGASNAMLLVGGNIFRRSMGVVLALVGVTQAVNAIVRTALGLYTVPGWTSVMVVVCLIGSAILISIGVLGEYIGRIFEESKGRPLYIVAESVNAGHAKPKESSETYAQSVSAVRF